MALSTARRLPRLTSWCLRSLSTSPLLSADCTETKSKSYSVVSPQQVNPLRNIPPDIIRPCYSETGQPPAPLEKPETKDENSVESMRQSCRLAAQILSDLERHVKIGVTTEDLDRIAHEEIIRAGAYPSPLNYRNFPKSICTSVNNVACHGIPDDRPLENGDIINIDVTVYFNGFHGDCSKTFLVGDVDPEGRRLVEATQVCLDCAIKTCRPGQKFSAIGSVIFQIARRYGYQVVPAFVGHGIGSYFHGPPDIFHTPNRYPGRMVPGNTFTIEPILSEGAKEVEILEDGWTAVTIDESRTAQFEHTVLITADGVEVLTCLP